ncbi:MAG TPA: hypothetical protein VN666_03730 [Nitrospira sp.]|nr:hypothetical protein [Nitrospira sp.]
MSKEIWLFIFSAIGATAGGIQILQAFGIKMPTLLTTETTYPKGLRIGLFFVVFSLILNAVGFYFLWHPRDPFAHWKDYVKEQINSKTFRNEVVILDGKSYRDCTFIDVTFQYDGNAPFEFTHNKVFTHGVQMKSYNRGFSAFVQFMLDLKVLKDTEFKIIDN